MRMDMIRDTQDAQRMGWSEMHSITPEHGEWMYLIMNRSREVVMQQRSSFPLPRSITTDYHYEMQSKQTECNIQFNNKQITHESDDLIVRDKGRF